MKFNLRGKCFRRSQTVYICIVLKICTTHDHVLNCQGPIDSRVTHFLSVYARRVSAYWFEALPCALFPCVSPHLLRFTGLSHALFVSCCLLRLPREYFSCVLYSFLGVLLHLFTCLECLNVWFVSYYALVCCILFASIWRVFVFFLLKVII